MSDQTTSQARRAQRGCILMPAYNEEIHIAQTVKGALAFLEPVVVIDDGSGDGTVKAARDAGAIVIEHVTNKGKGAALQTGFDYAQKNAYDYVITMDSDGQHAPEDIPAFVEHYERTGMKALIGDRMADTSDMPRIRRWTNRFMSGLLSRQMGQFIADSQNGYRLYHSDVLPLLDVKSGGYAAESEVLLRLADQGVRMGSVPVKTIYDDEVSEIHPIRDTIIFFNMLRKHKDGRRKSEHE